MAQTSISIRVDEDVKSAAETLLSQMGLTLSAATNIFYRQIVRTKSIPFHITTIEIDPETEARKEFGRAIKSIQDDSILNGTDKIAMDEINDIINECRREARATK